MISVPVLVFVSATTVIVFLFGYISFIRSYHVRRGSKLPSGNMGWPLIGETLSFLKPHSTTVRGEYMDHQISRFGRIFSSNLFGNQMVVSADAEFIRFILKNDMTMFEPGWPRSMVKLLGESTVILMMGDAHKNMRSVYLEFLSGERLRTVFLEEAEQIASLLLSSWNGSVISATDEANKFSFYVMLKETISMSPGDPQMENVWREYEAYIKGLASLPLYLPRTAYWKAFKIEDMIRKKSTDGNARAEEDDDFVSWIMRKTNYSPEQIGRLLQHLLAGNDTTSRAISLMIYFLEGCPKAIEQLREEHLQIIKLKKQIGEEKLTWEEYKGMEFTQCVINETLRLGNIASYLLKRAKADFQYKGYVIPRGCTVIAHTSAVHFDPNLFEGPEHFNPWRWLCPSGLQKTIDFMPFGGAARLCPGKELARLEMTVFLHHLILKYDWELVEHDPPMRLPHVDFAKGLQIRVRALSTESHTM